MPYDPTTYKTERLSLIGNPEQRSGNSVKDQKFVNFFPEVIDQPSGKHFFLQQRAGLVYNYTTATGTARGIYYYAGARWSVVGNTLYKENVVAQVLSTSTGSVGFYEYSGLLKYLIVLDGTSGWVINAAGTTITKITDADFPTPHCTQAAFLDGYLFLAKSGTDDIYNCVLEDPLSWQAGDFVTAEMYPDNITALTRQGNYIMAVGSYSTEFFYDTGEFPGTPLARNQAGLRQIGSPAPDTVLRIEDEVLMVGQTAVGGRTIWLFKGFDPEEIAIDPVRRSLNAEGTNISNAKAFVARIQGHRFYVLNLTSITWVYDLDLKMWHNWADYTGTAKFPCDHACDYNTGTPLLQNRTSGLLYTMQDGVSTDATGAATVASITAIATTARQDFGMMNAKFMHRFTLISDVPAASAAASINLQWSDDDYQTWTTARTIVLDDTMPTITQLGRFRRRAFKLTYSQPYPIRLEGFEVDINTGSQ